MADSLDMKLEVKGDEEIKQMLTGIGLDVRNLRGAMNEVGRSTIKVFSGQVFASRGGFIGERWDPLNKDYAVWKAKKWAGKPPLVRTGKMQGSFRYDSTGTSVTIENTAAHFKYHQSSAARKKIPRRAMIGIYTGMQEDVRDTIALVLSRKIKERAGR